MRPVRRKWDYERRSTRWRVNAKIGTIPVGIVFMSGKPVAGARLDVWRQDRSRVGRVLIEQVRDDGYVFCSLF